MFQCYLPFLNLLLLFIIMLLFNLILAFPSVLSISVILRLSVEGTSRFTKKGQNNEQSKNDDYQRSCWYTVGICNQPADQNWVPPGTSYWQSCSYQLRSLKHGLPHLNAHASRHSVASALIFEGAIQSRYTADLNIIRSAQRQTSMLT